MGDSRQDTQVTLQGVGECCVGGRMVAGVGERDQLNGCEMSRVAARSAPDTCQQLDSKSGADATRG